MRVVAVAHAYPRWDGDVAGSFIERLNLALRDRGHAVVVVAPSDEGKGGLATNNGIDVVRVRYFPASLETLAYRGTMADAARSLGGRIAVTSMIASQAGSSFASVRADRADLLHAHWWIPGGISALLASLASHRPYVVTLHGTDVAILQNSNTARKLARLVLRRAAVVTAVSSYLAEKAAAIAGLDPADIVVQPMPLNVARYSRRSGGGDGVVTVGRLVRQKNISVILEAVALLRKRGKPVKLKVLGDGPERTALEHRARQLGIADLVRFIGAVPPESVPTHIGDADVFAFPALGEGLGLAAAEAFMLGVPVIAARQGGGVKDFVPPTGAGRLVDATDAHALAREIETIVGDAEHRRLAWEVGETLKQQLSPAFAAELFEAVYDRALERG